MSSDCLPRHQKEYCAHWLCQAQCKTWKTPSGSRNIHQHYCRKGSVANGTLTLQGSTGGAPGSSQSCSPGNWCPNAKLGTVTEPPPHSNFQSTGHHLSSPKRGLPLARSTSKLAAKGAKLCGAFLAASKALGLWSLLQILTALKLLISEVVGHPSPGPDRRAAVDIHPSRPSPQTDSPRPTPPFSAAGSFSNSFTARLSGNGARKVCVADLLAMTGQVCQSRSKSSDTIAQQRDPLRPVALCSSGLMDRTPARGLAEARKR